MLKRCTIALILGMLCGCEKPEAPKRISQETIEAFSEYHEKACGCVLDSMPDVKRVLRKNGKNAEDLFCLWSSNLCTNSKSQETIQRSVQIIKELGEFSCDSLGLFSDIAKEQNVDALCARFWSMDAVIFLSQLVRATNKCNELFGLYTDCFCAVKNYVASITDKEYEQLVKNGYVSEFKLETATYSCHK
ncbi:MAG: hypothetical protein J6W40_00885 [Alphaproteobacteria bacterium]|nr:hypothetical protein [Alphaproteobacteria bacterium]